MSGMSSGTAETSGLGEPLLTYAAHMLLLQATIRAMFGDCISLGMHFSFMTRSLVVPE